MLFAPSALSRAHRQPNASLFRELERIRQQVFQYLLQTLGVGDDAASKMGTGYQFEAEVSIFGLVRERTFHHIQQAREENFLRLDRYRARFDLRQIQNVGDQIEQVRSSAMNRARELDLLIRQISIRIVA